MPSLSKLWDRVFRSISILGPSSSDYFHFVLFSLLTTDFRVPPTNSFSLFGLFPSNLRSCFLKTPKNRVSNVSNFQINSSWACLIPPKLLVLMFWILISLLLGVYFLMITFLINFFKIFLPFHLLILRKAPTKLSSLKVLPETQITFIFAEWFHPTLRYHFGVHSEVFSFNLVSTLVHLSAHPVWFPEFFSTYPWRFEAWALSLLIHSLIC